MPAPAPTPDVCPNGPDRNARGKPPTIVHEWSYIGETLKGRVFYCMFCLKETVTNVSNT